MLRRPLLAADLLELSLKETFIFPFFFKLSVAFVIQKTLSMETNNLANEDAMQAVETKSSENGKLSVLLVLTATIGQRLTNPVASA